MKILLFFLFCFSCVNAGTWVESYVQAELAIQNNEYDKAFEYYQASIANDPDQTFAYLGIAQVYLKRDDYLKAREALDMAKSAKEGFDHENVQKYRTLMMGLFAQMGDIEQFQHYQDEFLANSYDIPRTYRDKDYIYILNAPKSKWFRNTIETATRKYEDVDFIQWKEDIGIIKLKNGIN